MTTLRKAAQQALEALEEYQAKGAPFMSCDAAADALRAALADQDRGWYTIDEINAKFDPEPVQEPTRKPLTEEQAEPQDDELSAALGWPGGISNPVLDRKELLQQVAALRAALAQQAEPVEPVAWMYTGIKQDGTTHGPHLVWKPEYMDAMSASKGAKATPLYTAPLERKPVQEPVAAELRRLHAELERCKQVCAATSEAWREEAALAEPVQEERAVCDECGKHKLDGWALYCVACVEPVFAPSQPPDSKHAAGEKHEPIKTC